MENLVLRMDELFLSDGAEGYGFMEGHRLVTNRQVRSRIVLHQLLWKNSL